MKTFETTVVIEGVEEITGRIPAEKFIRYMHEVAKNQQFIVEKMRLRLATTKDKHAKARLMFTQKQELGESLCEPDFEKIQIENKNYIAVVELKNIHLMELKKMAGTANLELSTHKKYLLSQVDELKQLQEKIEQIRQQERELEKENEEVEAQIKTEQQKHDKMKKYVESYKVPDVMEYIVIKNAIHKLKGQERILARKLNISTISLASYLREMKQITGMKTNPEWLLPPKKKSYVSLSSLEDIEVEKASSVESLNNLELIQIDFEEALKKK